MALIITSWALDSYSKLRQNHVFSEDAFFKVIRPDVLLLKDGFPSPHEQFYQAKFWGPAISKGRLIPNAYKMKWHNIGEGKVQLRLCIVILNEVVYLCNGYVKDDKSELREMASLKLKLDKIKENKFIKLGVL